MSVKVPDNGKSVPLVIYNAAFPAAGVEGEKDYKTLISVELGLQRDLLLSPMKPRFG